ncbi:endogenous retrovirus group K member 8 Gag polyprotein-like [Dasypus novemcinctus]|uniref:endogenous retrovirus group K member 8 Gag polyprotein-like n=1 Tax=Dasypus novemcinctus TaxID=9361 RepID=UPI00265DFC21|nr:endogenous retrovirus group K member 8 Gag polyprotein-like [Dasypus novemcinctus]
MGQEQSKHNLYLNQIKKALKARGIVVKKKGLSEFFKFIIKTCPWFPDEGTIDERCWRRVSDCLNDYYKTFGPSRIPVTAFSYCQLIHDIIPASPCFPDITEIITEGENILKSQAPSRAPSRAPSIVSVAGNSPNTDSLPDNQAISFDEDTGNPSSSRPERPPPTQADIAVPTVSAPLDPYLLPQPNLTPREVPVFKPPPYASADHLPSPALLAPVTAGPSPLPDLTPIITLTQRLETLTHTLISATSSPQSHQVFPILRSGWSTSAGRCPPAPGPPAPDTPTSNRDLLALSDNSTDESGEDEPRSRESEPGPSNRPELGEDEPRSTRPEPTPLRKSAHARRRSPSPDVYRPLSFKTIEKFKKAVHSYGPSAPFTLALIEALGDKELTPNDWFQLAKAVLSGGDFITWRSHYEEAARERAIRNEKKEETKGWTVRKFMGQGSAQSNAAQAQFSAGLISQIQRAALKAWKNLPQKNHPTSSLAKLTQGPEEPFADFLSRLQATAEHLFGDTETGCDFIKQLAFENANEPCQPAIHPFRNTDLSNWVRLCANITPAKTIGMAIGAAFQDLKRSLANPPVCFNCQQMGHFARSCPLKGKRSGQPPPAPAPSLANKSRSARPATACPKCKKGFHWASECHSRYDINGQPIGQLLSGNPYRGQPQAPPKTNPGAVRFVQPTPFTTPALPPVHHPVTSPTYGGQQQEAQDWTSVPPPSQY